MNRRSALIAAGGMVLSILVVVAAIATGLVGPDTATAGAAKARHEKPHVRTIERTVTVHKPGGTVTVTGGAVGSTSSESHGEDGDSGSESSGHESSDGSDDAYEDDDSYEHEDEDAYEHEDDDEDEVAFESSSPPPAPAG